MNLAEQFDLFRKSLSKINKDVVKNNIVDRLIDEAKRYVEECLTNYYDYLTSQNNNPVAISKATDDLIVQLMYSNLVTVPVDADLSVEWNGVEFTVAEFAGILPRDGQPATFPVDSWGRNNIVTLYDGLQYKPINLFITPITNHGAVEYRFDAQIKFYHLRNEPIRKIDGFTICSIHPKLRGIENGNKS